MKSSLLVIMLFPSVVLAWGKTGHRVVGEVASQYLETNVAKKVKKILGHESLAHSSVWADFIKSESKMRKKYSHLHYLNTTKGTKVKNRTVNKRGDILTAIDDFSKVLKNNKSTLKDRRLALRFLVHLIGDLHQPLHTGYKKDKGGNSVKLNWFGKKTNLHAIWDEELISLEQLSFTEYTQKINFPSKLEIKRWQNSTPLDWAQESSDYLKNVYNYKEKKYWEYDYSYKHINFLNQRLLQAGIRLAGHLNKNIK